MTLALPLPSPRRERTTRLATLGSTTRATAVTTVEYASSASSSGWRSSGITQLAPRPVPLCRHFATGRNALRPVRTPPRRRRWWRHRRTVRSGKPARCCPSPTPPNPHPTLSPRLALQRRDTPVQHLAIGFGGVRGDGVHQRSQRQHPAASARK